MALVNFKKGLLANLPATKTAGTFYITTDERAMYLDVDASTRIRLGDFQEFATVEALTANSNPNTTSLYYVSDINCLAKWNGSEYIQINRDTGMTSVEVTGEGNALTAAVYDAAGRKLTLTKGATYMTAADVDGKISNKVGTLTYNDTTYDTVKAYVDAKTSGIATDAALTELTGRVSTAEGEIDALQAAIADGGSVANAIAAAKKAGDDAQAAADAAQSTADSKTTMAEVEAKNYATKTEAQGYANAKDTAISAAQAAADAAQADVDALEGKVGTVPADKTVVQMISDAQAAATYDDTALKGRVAANETAIATLNGTGEGSVSKQVADAVASIVADAPEAYDTLKEISDWISSHASDASAMNSQINTNKTDIANLTALVGSLPETASSDTVVGYINEAIAALKIGDYAKAADLTAAVARIDTAEGKITTLEGKVKAIEDKNISDGANKVEASTTNGNIKIDDVETVVYTHPAAHAISEVTGLQDALDAKATAAALNETNANVTANTNAISVINGTGDGSFAKADATLKTELQTYADQSETDAVATSKAYTESCLQWGEF